MTVSRKTFVKNTFHLGPFSEIIGWISAIWLVVTSVFFFMPNRFPINPESFNYTPVVVGGTFIIAFAYWFFPVYGARTFFTGPKRSANDVGGKHMPLVAEGSDEKEDWQ